MKSNMKKLIAFVCILVLGFSAMSAYTPVKEVEANTGSEVVPVHLAGFRHVTLDSFYNKNYGTVAEKTMSDKTYTGNWRYYLTKEHETVAGSFDKTMVSFMMQCATAGTTTKLKLIDNDGLSGGIDIRKDNTGARMIFCNASGLGISDNNLGSDNVIYLTHPNASEGKTFNDKFLFQISVEFGNFADETIVAPDGIDKNDIKIGLYFDGYQYDVNGDSQIDENDYIIIRNCDTSKIGANFGIVGSNSNITLESVLSKVSGPYLKWSDFASDGKVAGNQVWMSVDKAYRLDNTKYPDVQKMDGTTFEANVKFTLAGIGNRIYYGGKGNWFGVALYVESGNLTMRQFDGAAPAFIYLDGTTPAASAKIVFSPSVALGESTFLNTEFTLGITTLFGDYDNDGYEDDVELGFFFNGQLYNNRYIYLKDYLAKDDESYSYYGNYVGVYSVGNDAGALMVRNAPEGKGITQELTSTNSSYKTIATDFAEGATAYIGETEVDAREGLSTAGDYTIKDGTGEKTLGQVVLYEEGDAHPDGEIDVIDWIAMKKVNYGQTLSTWSGTMGAYAADFDATYVVDSILGTTAE